MVDNRTRVRLTGAAILVALIVLLVPELLSRPRHAGLQPAATVDEAPIRSYTLSLSDAPQSVAPATASGARPDWPPIEGPAHAADSRAQAASGAARTADNGARPAPGNAGSAAAPAAATPAGGTVVSPAPAPATRAEGAARGENAERGASDARWAVQVGSFGSRENADRLVRRLKVKGYGAFVTESSSRGRKWYRVRVGPQRDRAAADAIAVRLRKAGLWDAVAQPK